MRMKSIYLFDKICWWKKVGCLRKSEWMLVLYVIWIFVLVREKFVFVGQSARACWGSEFTSWKSQKVGKVYIWLIVRLSVRLCTAWGRTLKSGTEIGIKNHETRSKCIRISGPQTITLILQLHDETFAGLQIIISETAFLIYPVRIIIYLSRLQVMQWCF